MELHYDELRRLVADHMRRRERIGHTLDATAVVHEAYLRLLDRNQAWRDDRHFRRAATRAVYQVLVDHARRRNADKRGGARRRTTLSSAHSIEERSVIDVLALHEAMEQLGDRRPRQREVVLLRFFGDLSFDEIGDSLGISPNTAREYWAFGRAFLLRRLRSGDR